MIFKIRDSVDVYTIQDEILFFYFINTRKSLEYKVTKETINLVKLIDGKRDSNGICNIYNKKYNATISLESINKVLVFLKSINVVVEVKEDNDIETDNRYERQINYLAEFKEGTYSGIENQIKIKDSNIAIFGVGAIGGNIAMLLAMAGVENFTLIDYKTVKETDSCRHMYYRKEYIGDSKVDALKKEIKRINSKAKVDAIFERLTPDKDIDKIISKSSFIVNTADEPYIGHTSLKISKKCVELQKAHYIGGGFDIHVMSTGELIIPGKTPCVNCYMRYFKKKLSNWKPKNKKVVDEINEYGGFPSQSLFSASYASTQIIKYICGVAMGENGYLTRGEMDIDTYKIQYLNVEKDPNCPVCGGIKHEA